MDFVTHLPLSNGKTAIWVIVDRFTKYAHFLPLPTRYTAPTLATLFLRDIYRLHGLPKTIVSDRDPLFLSHFWKQLFSQLGTRLLHSSAYHPQTDGQTEVVNRCVESYLRAFASEEPRSWSRYLYLAEFWYNTSYHSSINMTPHKALYGKEVAAIHDYTARDDNMASIDDSLIEHQRLITLLKEALDRSKARMIKQANKHRIDKQFNVGDFVYLKLRNYRQISIEQRPNQKLAKRYFGPYKIVEKVGTVAYRLELPLSARIHPVFHVSLLRASTKPGPCSDLLSIDPPDSQPALLPEAIIHTRLATDGTQQILINWQNRPIEEATWEDYEDCRQRYPEFFSNLEDEVAFDDRGIVTSDVGPSLTAQNATRPKRTTKLPARFQE